MIFNDNKLDKLLSLYKISQLSFMTAEGGLYYKQRFIEHGYIDITSHFIDYDAASINIDFLKDIMDNNNTIFDLNSFYNHWVINSHKSYQAITWSYYKVIKTLLEFNKKNFVAIAYKRPIHLAVEKKIEILDNILFCDFAELYIYPLYHEYKLFTQDTNTFNQFIEKVSASGEVPEKYNVCMIQYMKLGGNATEKVFY